MPSQVVTLSSSLVHSISNQGWFPLGHAFGIRDLEAQAVIGPDGSPSIRIHLDPEVHCPTATPRFVDDRYALLLTSSPPQTRPTAPDLLPGPMASRLLDLTQTALEELPHLSGHDRLEIPAAFATAQQQAPVPRPTRRRDPSNAYEAGLRAEAERLQRVIGPALAALDRKLTSYQAHLRQTCLEEAVIRLGLQAELGSNLEIQDVESLLRPVRRWNHRRGTLRDLLRATHNNLAGFQRAAERIHQAEIANTSWLTLPALLDLHTTLLAGVPGEECAARLRRREMRIQSPFDGHVSVLELPGDEVGPAFEAFVAGFDAGLWREIHAVVRLAMAHIELMRIHPFSDANGRLGRLLLQALWLEAGLPALPLEALLHWNRVSYLHYVARAVERGETLGFVHFLMKIIAGGVSAGRQMTRYLRPWVRQFQERLLDRNCSGRFAGRAARLAASMVLGPDPMFVRRTMHGVELCFFLQGEDCVTELDARTLGFWLGGYESDAVYSAPVARRLLEAPLVRL